MSLIDRIEDDLKTAMLEKDNERRDALRLILASLRSSEKDLQRPLSDDEELQVLQRERNVNVRLSYYVISKTLTLGVFALVQCILFVLIGNYVLEIRGMFWIDLAIMFMTAMGGVALERQGGEALFADRDAGGVVAGV